MEYPVIDLQETGKRIRALRKERHLSVRNVCEFMGGISQQAVYKWEAGICLPSLDNMYALSILFQVSINDMIEETRQVSSFFVCMEDVFVEDTQQKFNYRLNEGSQETAYNKSVRLKRNHEGRAIIMRINALYSKTTGNSRDWIARNIVWTRSA